MPEWIWHWSGYAVALLACTGALWAMFWDRARGRKRCRRCWYDMNGAVDRPAICPECGKVHAKPGHLRRTRRRWVPACALLLVMVVGGYGLWVVPRVQDEGIRGLVPTALMVSIAPLIAEEDDWPTLVRGNSIGHMFWDRRWDRAPNWYRSMAVEWWYLTGWRRQHGAMSQFEGSAVDRALRSEVWAGRLDMQRAGDWAAWAIGVENISVVRDAVDDVSWIRSGSSYRGHALVTELRPGEDPATALGRPAKTHFPSALTSPDFAVSTREPPDSFALVMRLFLENEEYCRLVVRYETVRVGEWHITARPVHVSRLPLHR